MTHFLLPTPRDASTGRNSSTAKSIPHGHFIWSSASSPSWPSSYWSDQSMTGFGP
jgi:hypothetical protein